MKKLFNSLDLPAKKLVSLEKTEETRSKFFRSDFFKMLGDTKKKLKRTRNMDAHIRLIQIAENCEESVFQKNEEYLKFKAQKNISTLDMEILIGRLYTLDYPEEKIYWNKRALEEKVGDKETRYPFFYNLVCAYSKLKEYELVLEYGQKPMAWLDSFEKKLWADTKMINCLTTASKQLKRFKESIVYEKERLKVMIKGYNSGQIPFKIF